MFDAVRLGQGIEEIRRKRTGLQQVLAQAVLPGPKADRQNLPAENVFLNRFLLSL